MRFPFGVVRSQTRRPLSLTTVPVPTPPLSPLVPVPVPLVPKTRNSFIIQPTVSPTRICDHPLPRCCTMTVVPTSYLVITR